MRKFRKLVLQFTLLTTLCSLLCCNRSPKTISSRIVITGTIIKPTTGIITLQAFKDRFIPFASDSLITTDSVPSIKFKFIVLSDTFLTGYIKFNEEIIPIFIEPNDSQHIEFDPNIFDHSLMLTGRGSNNSKLYSSLIDLLDTNTNKFDSALAITGASYGALSQKIFPWQNYRELVNHYQEELKRQLQMSHVSFHASPTYLEYEHAEDQVTYLYRLISFWMQNIDSNSCRPYIDSVVNSFSIFIPAALSTKSYLYFTSFYCQYKPGNEYFKNLKKQYGRELNELDLDSALKQFFPPRFYAYYKTDQICTYFLLNSKFAEKSYQDFARENIYPPYTQFLQKKYLEWRINDSISTLNQSDLSKLQFKKLK